jgi:phosphoglycolate phosphatase
MAETGIEPHRTVMVGDTTFDMQMARSAGVGALGAGWGYHDAEELRGAGAHGVIDSAHDLHEAVERYFTLGEEAA